jgi:hypothetical protein
MIMDAEDQADYEPAPDLGPAFHVRLIVDGDELYSGTPRQVVWMLYCEMSRFTQEPTPEAWMQRMAQNMRELHNVQIRTSSPEAFLTDMVWVIGPGTWTLLKRENTVSEVAMRLQWP